MLTSFQGDSCLEEDQAWVACLQRLGQGMQPAYQGFLLSLLEEILKYIEDQRYSRVIVIDRECVIHRKLIVAAGAPKLYRLMMQRRKTCRVLALQVLAQKIANDWMTRIDNARATLIRCQEESLALQARQPLRSICDTKQCVAHSGFDLPQDRDGLQESMHRRVLLEHLIDHIRNQRLAPLARQGFFLERRDVLIM